MGGGADLAETLGGIIDARECHVAHEGEDDGIRMQRPDTSKGDVGQSLRLEEPEGDRLQEFPVHLPPGELGGGKDTDQHADDAPEQGGNHEPAYRSIVVGDGGRGGHAWTGFRFHGLPFPGPEEPGASPRGSSESRSRLLSRRRRYSPAKQQMKIPARQLLIRIVRARTFTRSSKRFRRIPAPHALL